MTGDFSRTSALERVAGLLDQGDDFCAATVVETSAAEVPLAAKAICLPDGRVELFGIPRDREKALSGLAAKALSSGSSACVELEPGVTVYLEANVRAARLLVCGAGHIAVSLARFALETGFHPTILDDRPEYASPARFPGCRVVAEDFSAFLGLPGLRTYPYVAVITRGHQHDLECLRQVLRWKTYYVGLIGSKARIAVVKGLLEREGLPRAGLDGRLFGPIGLDIGAESPEEIALCIAAELVAVRRLGPAGARRLRAGTRT